MWSFFGHWAASGPDHTQIKCLGSTHLSSRPLLALFHVHSRYFIVRKHIFRCAMRQLIAKMPRYPSFIPPHIAICFLACLFSASVIADDRVCYYPSGETALVADEFQPCNGNSTSVSMCCDVKNGDMCTPEGLCLSGVAYYRDMCTDQTWQAPECVALCTC
jgi:hypothetical protein